jgi:membrane-associated phospholipid phosphatase
MKKWIVLSLLPLGLAFVYDWPLAIFFIKYKDQWAIFLKDYGHLPSFYLALVSLYGFAQTQSFVHKALLKTLVILGSFAWVYYLSLTVVMDVIFGTTLIFLSVILSVKIIERMPEKRVKAWFKLSTLIFLFSFLGPNLIKLFTLRFRPTLYFPGCMHYSLYLKPVLFNLEYLHQSFPSGHTALAMSLFSLLFLAPHSSKLRKIVSIVLFGFVLLMGLSRMILGDHFASDVVFSILSMTLIIKYFEHKIFTKFD